LQFNFSEFLFRALSFCRIFERFTSVYSRKFRDTILQHGIPEEETVLRCVNQGYYVCFLCYYERLTRWSRQASKVPSIIHSVWFISSDLSCLYDFFFFFLFTDLRSAHSNIVKRITRTPANVKQPFRVLKYISLRINVVNYKRLRPFALRPFGECFCENVIQMHSLRIKGVLC